MWISFPKIEVPERPFVHLGGIVRHGFGHNLVNGFSAFLFAASGPGAMIFAVGVAADLPATVIGSWIFAGYFLSGMLSLLVCYLFRQPLTFGYSMPAVVIVGPALMTLSFSELIGAYIVTGVLILFLAATGLIRRATAALPQPIVMAMVAGVFLPYGLKMIEAFETDIWLGGSMIFGYMIVSAFPMIKVRFPPLLAALLIGSLLTVLGGKVGSFSGTNNLIVEPVFFRPDFNLKALLEFVIPLTITVVGIHNPQGFAILKNEGYRPPQNLSTLICGVGSVLYGVLGCVPTVVTGPANAILNVSGDKRWRFVGGLWFGFFFMLFGVFAPLSLQLGMALPYVFIATLAGLAMIPVLQGAFVSSFQGNYSLGALVTFLITVAGVSIFGVGAAFWGLVFGYLVGKFVEQEKR